MVLAAVYLYLFVTNEARGHCPLIAIHPILTDHFTLFAARYLLHAARVLVARCAIYSVILHFRIVRHSLILILIRPPYKLKSVRTHYSVFHFLIHCRILVARL